MLILILIHVQYSQNAVFSFEKRLDHQNHPSSGSHHPVKLPPPQQNFMGGGFTPHSLLLFEKPCGQDYRHHPNLRVLRPYLINYLVQYLNS